MFFKDPDQLLEIFATLEEKNLFLIQQGQEAEENYEKKSHEYEELKSETDREINVLRAGLADVEDRKMKILKESKTMSTAA